MGAEKDNCETLHRVTLQNRNQLEISGVTDVVSFDEQAVILNTVCGNMTVEGNNLSINVLSTEKGVVSLDGKVDMIGYEDQTTDSRQSKQGFLKGLFR